MLKDFFGTLATLFFVAVFAVGGCSLLVWLTPEAKHCARSHLETKMVPMQQPNNTISLQAMTVDVCDE